jgi:predicted enzyme related to lactoylglutathione lyase
MNKWINWFEIPVSDFERAKQFYAAIFDIQFYEHEMMGTKMAMFPTGENEGGGALVCGEDYSPSSTGTLVYLNGGNDLNTALNKVEAAGGQVFVPKTHIGEGMGYFAIFSDTEGNKIALHSIQ